MAVDRCPHVSSSMFVHGVALCQRNAAMRFLFVTLIYPCLRHVTVAIPLLCQLHVDLRWRELAGGGLVGTAR